MPTLNNDLINEIRNNTDIVEVISNYVSLTKSGKNYFGICPFHDDNHPSMSVSPEKQIYKCFSCGATGNVFTFVEHYEHISFIDAVKLLGNKLGYSIGNTNNPKKKYNECYEIYRLANKFFQNNINTSLGKNAIRYLHDRQINDDIIKKFNIGLSLNKNKLTEMLESKKYPINKLIELGLTTDNSNDFFQNRIMFPIWNNEGEVVAFSGRIYNTKDNSKYVNSKESIIFKKGNILYNYHNVREFTKKNDRVILMEGFMDVIRAYSIGITNCVASLGTSVTIEQVNILKRMTDNIILCFDGDKAGRHASMVVSSMFEKVNMQVKIVLLEDNLDPDEYILKYGYERFKNKIDNPLNLVEFKMQVLKENKNLNDIDDLTEYINSSLGALVDIEDKVFIELTLKKLATSYQIEYNTLKEKYEDLKQKSKKEEKIIINKLPIKKYNKYDIAQRNLIFYMLRSEKAINMVKNKVAFFPTDIYRHLSNELIYYFEKYGVLTIADFISYASSSEELNNTLNEILNIDKEENYKEEELEDYIKVLSNYNKELKKRKLKEELNKELDPLKQAKIIEEIMKIRSEKND